MKKLTAICAAVLLSTQVSAQNYFSEFIIFGDSLLDTGNLGLRFTNKVGDGNGDFTTGAYAQIAPQHLGAALGLASDPANPAPALGSGTNYAVGGYETSDILNSINGSGLNLPIGENNSKVNVRAAYLTEFGRVNPNALILIDGGGNDFLNGTANNQATIVASARTLVAGVSALSGAGGRYIMLSNLPDLGKTAALQAQNLSSPGAAATASAGAAGFNQAVQTFANFSSANIIPVDLAGMIDFISNNAEAYGFANGDLGGFDQRYMCFDDGVTPGGSGSPGCIEHPVHGIDGQSPNPDKLLFNDGVHPTARVGAITGDYLVDIVVAPQVVGQLPGLGMAMARTQQLSLEQVMRENRWLANTDRLFISAGGGNADEPGNGEQDNRHLTVGMSRAYSTETSLGLALTATDSELDSGNSEFSASSLGVSGLLNYREDRWLAEGSLGLSVMDYSELDRHFNLGQRKMTASGGSDGFAWQLNSQLGYNLLNSQTISVAPAVGFRYLATRVDGYTESGGAVSNYQWGDQSRDSRQLRVGVLSNIALNESVSLYAELFAVSELVDNDQTVEIRNTNLGFNSYRLPSYRVDGEDFVDASIGAAISFDHSRLALNASYSDEADGRQSLMLNYTLPF
ncbi:MAG: outer membrane lipase/esterase [Zhongshania sp.]|jgi:outer membrane lipase/esterase